MRNYAQPRYKLIELGISFFQFFDPLHFCRLPALMKSVTSIDGDQRNVSLPNDCCCRLPLDHENFYFSDTMIALLLVLCYHES
jgi:hypothetical protein